ncbi:MAG: hypothetical protein ACFFDT_09155 [Candidatus Hodarchaeota archaeon]
MSGRRTRRVGHVGGVRRASHRHIYHAPRLYRESLYSRRYPGAYHSPMAGSGICGIIIIFFLLINMVGGSSGVFTIIILVIIGAFIYQKQQGRRKLTPLSKAPSSSIQSKQASIPRPVPILPSKTTESQYCSQCGNILQLGDIFCVECGTKVI